MQRSQRYLGGSLDPHEDGRAGRDPELPRQPLAQERLVTSGRLTQQPAVEGPESLVDPVDLNAEGAPATGRIRREAVQRDERDGGFETGHRRTEFGRQWLAEEGRRRHDGVHGPEAPERQLA